jgi:hypothetical protein
VPWTARWEDAAPAGADAERPLARGEGRRCAGEEERQRGAVEHGSAVAHRADRCTTNNAARQLF